ncbi:hypothetical protein BCD48_24800 [Pseudofrankia sp. BMG5.36]|nr:hypothetical protein BCD48_24800 [Pseudofrankia sp. BMG5.36]
MSFLPTRLAAPAAFAFAGFVATTGAVIILGPDAASADATTYPLALDTSSQPASFTGPGQTLTLSYLITNNGDKTLYGVAVQDAHAGLSPIVCPDGPLIRGASKTCTATYVTTQADFDQSFITDVATATGIVESEGTTVTSPTANLTIPDDKPSAPLAATEPALEPDTATAGSTPTGPDQSLPVDSVAEGKAAESGPVAEPDPAPAAAPAAAPAPAPVGGAAPVAGAAPVGGAAPVAGAGPAGAGAVPVGAGAAPAGVSPVGAAPVQVTG